MKKSALLLSFFFVGLLAQAQKVYFVYIQSDSGTPFFIKMNEKVQSSSASGYIILSGLKDSTYNFSIGFPGKQQENKFSVTINKEDRGFLLRTAEKQPALFDLQSFVLYNATAGIKEPEYNVPELMAQADAFTKLLSQATDDPSILVAGPSQPKQQQLAVNDMDATQKLIASVKAAPDSLEVSKPFIAEVKKQDTVMLSELRKADAVVNTELTSTSNAELPKDKVVTTSSSISEPVQQTEVKTVEANVQTEQPYHRSVITRRSESSTTEGFGLVFLDNAGESTDTIRLLIPNPKMVARIQQPVKQEETEKQQEPAEQKEEKTAEAVALKNGCAELATDKDFLKLRKTMAAEETEADMVRSATKYFDRKCFSTEQIKNLSTLFLTPAGKYDFFNVAYGHASDKEVFGSLQAELKDDYYAGRFRDLVGGR